MKEQNNKKMKKFIMNRETMSDERIEFLKSLIETNPDKYNVMVDLRTGNIRLLKSTKSKYYVHIGQIDLRNPKSTKLYIQKVDWYHTTYHNPVLHLQRIQLNNLYPDY